MRWIFHPDVACTLRLGSKQVALDAAALQALAAKVAGSAEAELDRAVFRELFESGIIGVDALAASSETGRWRPVFETAALSPYLSLAPSFRSDKTALRDLEPAIGIYLRPEFARAAAALARRLRSALGRAVRSCAVRGAAFDRRRGLALIHKVAWDWIAAHPQTASWLRAERDSAGRVRLSVPDWSKVTAPEPAFTEVRITATHRGASRAFAAPLSELPRIAEALDALRAGTVPSRLDALLASPSVRVLLGAIAALDGFVPRAQAGEPYARDLEAALSVTHMGHACVIVDGGGRRALIDYCVFPWDTSYERQPVSPRQLGPVDALFFTHHHEDHLEGPALFLLPHDVPVYVPPQPDDPLAPRLADFLRRAGFRDVRELRPGEIVALGDGLEIEAVPFFGEASDTLGWRGNCYLASRRGRSALFHADAAPDGTGRSLLSDGALARLRARRGPIEILFGTWWQERSFLSQLTDLAIFHPDVAAERWLDDVECCDCPKEFVRDLAAACGAKLLLFYAESHAELFLPPDRMSEYIDAVSFLWDSREEVRRFVESHTGARVRSAQPFMRVVLPEEGEPRVDVSRVAPSRRHL